MRVEVCVHKCFVIILRPQQNPTWSLKKKTIAEGENEHKESNISFQLVTQSFVQPDRNQYGITDGPGVL